MENFKRDRQHYLTREQIVECLKKHHGTAFSGGFPERGLWGSSKYRGNTTGWVIAYFIWLYQISKMGEILP